MAGQIKTPSPIYGYEEDLDERCKERWKTVFRISDILVRILIRLRIRILLFSSDIQDAKKKLYIILQR
jgi:hypothetical protein